MNLERTALPKPSEARESVAMLLAFLDYKALTEQGGPKDYTMRSLLQARLDGYSTESLAVALFLANPVHTLPAVVKIIKTKYANSSEVEKELGELSSKYGMNIA